MLFRTALRSALPRLAVAPRVQPTRSFITSLPRLGGHVEPLLQGPGGKTGEVPTDYEQATGLERFELLHKLKGEEAFSLEPLEVPRLGTMADPIMVFSLVRCTGYPVDSHDTILFEANDEKPVRCYDAYKVDYQGLPDGEHDHHH
ncbi:hypothetical protein JCM8097_007090 [Rhodosporidiobolus ruineniae]